MVTTGAATRRVRHAGASVGVLLAGSAVAYGAIQLLKKKENDYSIFPTLKAAASVQHQPSVSARIIIILL